MLLTHNQTSHTIIVVVVIVVVVWHCMPESIKLTGEVSHKSGTSPTLAKWKTKTPPDDRFAITERKNVCQERVGVKKKKLLKEKITSTREQRYKVCELFSGLLAVLYGRLGRNRMHNVSNNNKNKLRCNKIKNLQRKSLQCFRHVARRTTLKSRFNYLDGVRLWYKYNTKSLILS